MRHVKTEANSSLSGKRYIRTIDTEAVRVAESGTGHIFEVDLKSKKFREKALCGYAPKKLDKKIKASMKLNTVACGRCRKIAESRGLIINK